MFDVPDEDSASFTIAGKQFNVGLVAKLLSAAIFIFNFLPYYTITELGRTTSVSTIDVLQDHFSVIELLPLLIPLVIFTIFQFKKNMNFLNNKIFLVSSIISIAMCLLLLFATVGLNNEVREYNWGYGPNILLSFTLWHWLSIIFYVTIGVISIVCRRILKKNKAITA